MHQSTLCLVFIVIAFNYIGTYQNDRALVTIRSKGGNGKGGKTGLYAQCAKVLNDEFPSMSVKCDPGNFKNKIHFMQQQYESAKR